MGFGKVTAAGIALALLLSGCAGSGFHHSRGEGNDDSRRNIYPANYKADLLAFLRAYLNDPTNIHDAVVAEPVQKSTGRGTRYVVCLKFSARDSSGNYRGIKEYTALFLAGRFDQMTEAGKDQCAQAAYQPFPELETLTR